LDLREIHELTSQMKRIVNSEKQIAKHLNETDRIYEADIEEIKKNRRKSTKGSEKSFFPLQKLIDKSSAGAQPILKNRQRVWEAAQPVLCLCIRTSIACQL